MYILNPFHFRQNKHDIWIWSQKNTKWIVVRVPYVFISTFFSEHDTNKPFSKNFFSTLLKKKTSAEINNIFFDDAVSRELFIKKENYKKYSYGIDRKLIDAMRNIIHIHPWLFVKTARLLQYKVDFIKPFEISIRNKKIKHLGLVRFLPSILSRKAYRTAIDKYKCYKLLSKKRIPVLKSIIKKGEKLISDSQSYFYPLVLKPRDGRGGELVFCNIRSAEEFGEVVKKFILKDKKSKKRDFLLEEYLHGDSYRILATSQRILSCVKQELPYVIGDGVSNVRSLMSSLGISFPNDEVSSDFLHSLNQSGLTLKSILPRGKKFELTRVSNRILKIENADALARRCFERDVKKILTSIGLKFASLDIVAQFDKEKMRVLRFAVVDINPCPEFAWHIKAYKNEEEFIRLCMVPFMSWLMSGKVKPLILKKQVNFNFFKDQ